MAKLKQSKPAQPTKKVSVNWRLLFSCLGILMFVVAACYGATLAAGPVFNDSLTMRLADSASQPMPAPLQMFLQPLAQPWVRQSFILDLENYTNPQTHSIAYGWLHLVNVYFHFVSVVAIFALVFRLAWRWKNDSQTSADPYRVALVPSLLFACHPLNTQAVSYISARYATLGGCNFFLALNFLLLGLLSKPGAGKVWGYILFGLFAWLCLCSSPIGIVLMPVSLIVFFLAKPRDYDWKDWALDHPISLGLFIALSLAMPFTSMLGFSPAAVANFYGMPQLPAHVYYPTEAKAFLTYFLRCAILPLGLTIDPPYAQARGLADPLSVIGLTVFLAFAAGAFLLRKRKLLVLGMTLIVMGFLPQALILQSDAVADPAFYLCLAGFCMVAADLLEPVLGQTWHQAAEKIVPLTIILSALCILHTLDFAGNEALIRQTLKLNDKSAVACSIAADNAYTANKFDDAVTQADKCLALQPENSVALRVKGLSLMKLHKYSDAETPLLKALQLSGNDRLSMKGDLAYALAEDTLRQGKADQFEKYARPALLADPKNPRFFYLMGLQQATKHDYATALLYLKHACDLGVVDAFVPLTDALLHVQRYADALMVAQAAAQVEHSPESRIALANAAIDADNLDVAEQALSQLPGSSDKDPKALVLRSILAGKKGDPAAAQTYKKEAIKIDAHAFDNVIIRKQGEEDKSPGGKR